MLVRLYWFFAPFTNDPITIVAIMRAMTHGGITQVLASVNDGICLPLHLYVLLVPGWFSRGPTLGAPVTPVEMATLCLTLVFTDVAAVAAVYRMGRKVAGLNVGLAAALFFALWPGSIYVDSWWTQTDIWYVAGMLLACWWMARERVGLAWLALALGMSIKWQAALLLPVFIVGTWRWFGWRGLAKGGLIAASVWGVRAAPIVLHGQGTEYFTKSLVQNFATHVVQRAQNFWFAVAPVARDLTDQSLDTNPWIGGVSFHDAALVLVALCEAIILVRLVWRSGPRSVAAAGALAVLATTMFSTAIATRQYMAAPALLLLAGLFDRKRSRLEPILLGIGAAGLLAGSAALLWRGQELGRPILSLRQPFYASLDQVLGGYPNTRPNRRIMVINWPWTIRAASPRLFGLLPVTPPALIMAWPYGTSQNVRFVQYPYWQTGASDVRVEFTSPTIWPNDLAPALQQTDLVETIATDIC